MQQYSQQSKKALNGHQPSQGEQPFNVFIYFLNEMRIVRQRLAVERRSYCGWQTIAPRPIDNRLAFDRRPHEAQSRVVHR